MEENNKNKKVFTFFIILTLILVVGITIKLILPIKDLNASNVLKKMKIDTLELMLVYPTSISDSLCTSKILFKDKTVKSTDYFKYTGGAIEVYKNERDANGRKQQLEYMYNSINSTFTDEMYGYKYMLEFRRGISNELNTYGHVFVNKNVVLILNFELSDEKIKEYKNEFNRIVNKISYTQEISITENELENRINTLNRSIDVNINTTKKEIESMLDKELDEIDKLLSDPYNLRNEECVNSIKQQIMIYSNIEYCSDKYKDWIKKINSAELALKNDDKQYTDDELIQLQKSIFKEYSYSEILSNAQNNNTIFVHTNGKVIEVSENFLGTKELLISRINNDGVEEYILIETIGSEFVLNENDIVELWVSISEMKDYINISGRSISLPRGLIMFCE